MPRSQTTVLALLALALLVSPASAQMRMGGGTSSGWAPAQIGARFGYDYNSTGSVVGAQLRVPVIPSGFVEIVPNADITFLTGLKEYQYGVDAVFVSGGRRGGIFLGGGVVWRNSIFDDPPNRETKTAPDVVAGVRSGPLFGGNLNSQLEIRWVFLDTAVKPRIFTFGVNFPLWGRS